MKSRFTSNIACLAHVCLIFLSLRLAESATGQTILPPTPPQAVTIPGKVIVKFKSRVDARTVATVLSDVPGSSSLNKKPLDHSTRVTQLFPEQRSSGAFDIPDLSRIFELTFPPHQDPLAIAAAMAAHPDVEYAEPRYARYLHFTPNDSLFLKQNHLSLIHAPEAWDIVQGDSTVVIGIVDSGVDWHHPDLQPNIWRNPAEIPGNGIDDDNNGYVDDIRGWDLADNDNDPSNLSAQPFGAHGTQVAGIAGAATNNSSGISGVGFKCKIMPVKAISDNADDANLAFGFEGIKYAAENGADIINTSWGGPGRSKFELEIVKFAQAMGSLIVASAGNENNAVENYPAAYPGVLSVASLDSAGRKAAFSSYGFSVDLSSPGIAILSTTRNRSFLRATGTSFSAPMVSGVAALVKSLHPSWRPTEIGHQIRVTADNIDHLNFGLANFLGRGKMNAFQAVTKSTPAIRISDVVYDDSAGNNNGIPEAGEVVQVTFLATNFLAEANNINFELQLATGAVSLRDPTARIQTIPAAEAVRNELDPFTLAFGQQIARGTKFRVPVRIFTDDGAYEDIDSFDLIIGPTFLDHKASNVTLTLTSNGSLGFDDFPQNQEGRGFIFNGDGKNLLFEGGIMAGFNALNLSDAARRNGTFKNSDFEVVPGGAVLFSSPGELADEQSTAKFSDRARPFGTAGIEVTQESYSFSESPNDDFILIKYTIENTSVVNVLHGLYFGLFLDWNIDDEHYNRNLVGYDSDFGLGYMFSPDLPTYCGVEVLNEAGVASYRAVNNATDLIDESGQFSEERKFEFLGGGFVETAIETPGDHSQVISTGPFTISPRSTVVAGFALLAGSDLEDLQANAKAAQVKWNEIVGINLPGNPPRTFSLNQNYPNPFNPATTLEYTLPEATFVSIRIYNILGQEVAVLAHEVLPAGRYSIMWSGEDYDGRQISTGIYIGQMRTATFSKSVKMLFLR